MSPMPKVEPGAAAPSGADARICRFCFALSFLPTLVDAEDPIATGQELFNRVERDLGKALGKFESRLGSRKEPLVGCHRGERDQDLK